MSAATAARVRERPRRPETSSATSRPLASERPRSPRRQPESQSRYRIGAGRWSWSSRRIASTASGVACCPRIASATSPGSSSVPAKTITETMTESRSRRFRTSPGSPAVIGRTQNTVSDRSREAFRGRFHRPSAEFGSSGGGSGRFGLRRDSDLPGRDAADPGSGRFGTGPGIPPAFGGTRPIPEAGASEPVPAFQAFGGTRIFRWRDAADPGSGRFGTGRHSTGLRRDSDLPVEGRGRSRKRALRNRSRHSTGLRRDSDPGGGTRPIPEAGASEPGIPPAFGGTRIFRWRDAADPGSGRPVPAFHRPSAGLGSSGRGRSRKRALRRSRHSTAGLGSRWRDAADPGSGRFGTGPGIPPAFGGTRIFRWRDAADPGSGRFGTGPGIPPAFGGTRIFRWRDAADPGSGRFGTGPGIPPAFGGTRIFRWRDAADPGSGRFGTGPGIPPAFGGTRIFRWRDAADPGSGRFGIGRWTSSRSGRLRTPAMRVRRPGCRKSRTPRSGTAPSRWIATRTGC